MMKVFISLLVMIFASQTIAAQEVYEKDIYQFINTRKLSKCVDENGKYYLRVSANKGFPARIDSAMLRPFRSYLNEEDVLSMIEQFKGNVLHSWDERQMTHANTLYDSELDTMNIKGFYALSLPLFSVDKNYVVLRLDYTCGNVCGEGCIFLYRRTEDGWEMVERTYCWMS